MTQANENIRHDLVPMPEVRLRILEEALEILKETKSGACYLCVVIERSATFKATMLHAYDAQSGFYLDILPYFPEIFKQKPQQADYMSWFWYVDDKEEAKRLRVEILEKAIKELKNQTHGSDEH